MKARYEALDGLRGFAAFAVVLTHALPMFGMPEFHHTALAVDFFFTLSGFVVAHAYDAPLLDGGLATAEFGRKRLLRLYPMIALGAGLGGIVTAISATHGAPQPLWEVAVLTLGAFTLTPIAILMGLGSFPVNIPLWSLFFEAVANVAYAFATRWRGALTGKVTLVVSALALVAATVQGQTLQLLGVEPATFLGGFARVAFSFTAGVLIYRARLHERAAHLPDWLLLGVLAAILFGPATPIPWLYDLASIFTVLPLIVIFGANERPTLIPTGVWRIAGEISYPLYAIHYPLLQLLSKINNHVLRLEPLPVTALGVAVCLVCAAAALRLYDQPARTWLASRERVRRSLRRVSTQTS